MISKFKQTEIGLIPEDWELRPIKKSFDFVGNNTFARDSMSNVGKVVNIHYGDVLIKYGANVDVSSDSVMFLDPSIRTTAVHGLQSGDIVMADTAEDETAGKCCEIIGAENKQVEAGLHTFVLRPREKYAPKFLGYAFNAEFYHNQLIPLMQGTKVTSVSKGAVETTFLLCPPLSEQEEIAAVLSNIDNLIIDLQSLIVKKLHIKQGTMQQLMTGKMNLEGYKNEWQEIEILYIDLGAVNDGVLGVCYEYQKNNAPSRAQRQIQENDILYQTVRPYQKNNLFIDFDASKYIASTGYAVIRCYDKYDSLFIYYMLHQDSFVDKVMENCTGTSYPAINPTTLSELKMRVPVQKDEQTAIATIISDMDKEIKLLQQKRDKYIAIKQGMMQELLTGKIRLV